MKEAIKLSFNLVKNNRLKYHYLLLFFLLIFLSCKQKIKKEEKKEENIYYKKAFGYLDNGRSDSAFFYFNKAKDAYLLQKDSLEAGKSLVNMGIISADKGDYFGAQEISLNALSYFDTKKENQHVYIRSNLNNLAIVTHKLEDYQNALSFYDSAISLSKDSLETRVILNNKAITYQKLKNYIEALKIYNSILKVPSLNRKEYARMLTNISYTKWLQNSTYNAVPDYLKALHIRTEEKDLLGLNSSYSHLAEYYADKRIDSALIYAKRQFHTANKVNSVDDRLSALQMLVRISPAKETKQYFEIYRNLNDSLQTARRSAKNQFALIRYQTEKRKAENLKLQKDNSDKKHQIYTRELMLLGALFAFVALTAIATLWYKKRKQRMELEAQNALRNSQLNTSKRVHDVVANGLYRVMTEIENQADMDRENVLDKIEALYEKSRDISYEEPVTSNYNFQEIVSEILTSFATDQTKILIAGNTADLWNKVSNLVKYEIEQILQELMVNMKKHSGASHVGIKFEQKTDQVNIYYTDNGVGLPKGFQQNNGFRNTGNRIDTIKGAITFETTGDKGLKIKISFPIS